MTQAKGEPKEIRVIEVGRTPKGTFTARGAGENESFMVGKGVAPLSVGQIVEALVSSSSYDGKTYWWINDWKLKEGVAQPTAAPDHSPPTSDAQLRFISNVVGQAILAKTVTQPEQVTEWALAAKQALADIGAM